MLGGAFDSFIELAVDCIFALELEVKVGALTKRKLVMPESVLSLICMRRSDLINLAPLTGSICCLQQNRAHALYVRSHLCHARRMSIPFP